MNIRHESLFSFETLLTYEPATRLSLVFDAMDAPRLRFGSSNPFARGAKGYNKSSLLRALIAKYVYGIANTAKLVERLSSDIRLRYDCGFALYEGIPSEATFCRFFKKLTDTPDLQQVFDDLVQRAYSLGIIKGTEIAIDASKIDAYEKTVPRNKVIKDGDHADWGSKQDTAGNQITWFGYKLHAAVDAASELPVAITITPANKHDVTQALPLVELVRKQCPQSHYFIMDKGYDTKEIYKVIREKQGQAIIPLNLRGEKNPPAGLNEARTPICTMGYPMVYWGANEKTGELKFRCPHVCGKVDCPMGSQWCSNSNYGRVVKHYIDEDPRNFCAPHRGTSNWETLYNKRTSVERLFSRLKEHLMGDSATVGGIKKVKAHLLLSCITMIAGTIAVNHRKQLKKTA